MLNSLGSIPVEASGSSVTIASKYKKSIFQFGLVADAQYADIYSNGNTRYYRASLEKLADAVKTFNEHDLAFTVHLGDLIDRDAASFSDILPVFNRINGPKYHLLGNHDYAMDANKVANLLGMPNFYYDFSQQGMRFVVLDTNDLSLYANPVGSEKYQHAQTVLDVLTWTGRTTPSRGTAVSIRYKWLGCKMYLVGLSRLKGSRYRTSSDCSTEHTQRLERRSSDQDA